MGFVLIIEDKRDCCWQVLEANDRIDPDDDGYGEDIHLVPIREPIPASDYLSFGVHEPTRNCPCHPRVEAGLNRNKVIHNDVIN